MKISISTNIDQLEALLQKATLQVKELSDTFASINSFEPDVKIEKDTGD